jgi:hypothetical protein
VGAWTRREKVFGNFIVFLSFQATETNINTLRRTKLIVFDILDSIHLYINVFYETIQRQ